jgi:hypothetical protein
VVHPLDFIAGGRDDAHRRPSLFERFFGALQLDLFKAISGEDGDSFVEKFLAHIATSALQLADGCFLKAA